ncbi:alkaline phytoceramidase [Ramicandelaber brevisporus]|nr:alkaline phytoceramidase [Ramicandelaber brevisporus]
MPVAAPPSQAPSTNYWGPITSNIDFCEANYELSPYIAEYWNCLSNSGYVALAMYGIYTTRRFQLEFRFIFCYLTVLCIGFGSGAFHATLRSTEQMYDEFPMMYCLSSMLYALYANNSPKGKVHYNVIAGLFMMTSVVMYFYLMLDSAVMFQVCFGIILTAFVISAYVRNVTIKIPEPSASSSSSSAAAANGNISNEKVPRKRFEDTARKALKAAFWTGLGAYLLGYILWVIDMNHCDLLVQLRALVGKPWDVVFQNHLWWHIFTGIGSHNAIVTLQYMRSVTLYGAASPFEIKWFAGIIIYLSKRSPFSDDDDNTDEFCFNKLK